MFFCCLGVVIDGKIQDSFKIAQDKRNANAFLAIPPSTKSTGLLALSGDIQKPIGVSEYQLTQSLPENLQLQLPSIEEIEQGLGGEL